MSWHQVEREAPARVLAMASGLVAIRERDRDLVVVLML
jgi:hypothetical protein